MRTSVSKCTVIKHLFVLFFLYLSAFLYGDTLGVFQGNCVGINGHESASLLKGAMIQNHVRYHGIQLGITVSENQSRKPQVLFEIPENTSPKDLIYAVRFYLKHQAVPDSGYSDAMQQMQLLLTEVMFCNLAVFETAIIKLYTGADSSSVSFSKELISFPEETETRFPGISLIRKRIRDCFIGSRCTDTEFAQCIQELKTAFFYDYLPLKDKEGHEIHSHNGFHIHGEILSAFAYGDTEDALRPAPEPAAWDDVNGDVKALDAWYRMICRTTLLPNPTEYYRRAKKWSKKIKTFVETLHRTPSLTIDINNPKTLENVQDDFVYWNCYATILEWPSFREGWKNLRMYYEKIADDFECLQDSWKRTDELAMNSGNEAARVSCLNQVYIRRLAELPQGLYSSVYDAPYCLLTAKLNCLLRQLFKDDDTVSYIAQLKRWAGRSNADIEKAKNLLIFYVNQLGPQKDEIAIFGHLTTPASILLTHRCVELLKMSMGESAYNDIKKMIKLLRSMEEFSERN